MNIFLKVKEKIESVKREAKNITWLSKKDILKYSIIVILVSIFIALILGLLDYIYLKILAKLII
ncbi:MAG: preprotein translocase subunit SecE [Minisyncoccia bacterium]